MERNTFEKKRGAIAPSGTGTKGADKGVMRVLVIDDHAVVRQGLSLLLSSDQENGVVVFEAANSAEALRLLEESDGFELILLDLMLPDGAGVSLLKEVRRLVPHAPTIVVSASEDPRDVQKALQSGANGYLPKSATPGTIRSAIRMVLGGDVYIPPFVIGRDTRADVVTLTQRQLETLEYLAKGSPNKVIANHMGVSEKTVKAHLTALFRELKVSNRSEAIEAARALGLI